MIYGKAREVLISKLRTVKSQLVAAIEGGDRDFSKQKELFETYAELQSAADVLAIEADKIYDAEAKKALKAFSENERK